MIQTWVLSFSDMADANDLSSKFEFGYNNRFKKNGIADRALLSMQMWPGYAGAICVVYTHTGICVNPRGMDSVGIQFMSRTRSVLPLPDSDQLSPATTAGHVLFSKKLLEEHADSAAGKGTVPPCVPGLRS